jgi:CxxH/CxxC protein (TIGR04129 family)
MLVVCKDHLELALEIFVDEYEEAPDVYALAATSFKAWAPPDHCDRCQQAPVYLVI